MSDDEKLLQTESIIREGLRQRWAAACAQVVWAVTEVRQEAGVHRALSMRSLASAAAAAREASEQLGPQRVREMALLVLEAEKAHGEVRP